MEADIIGNTNSDYAFFVILKKKINIKANDTKHIKYWMAIEHRLQNNILEGEP